jgi:uncharacterized protein YcbK (DUF882 family)
MDHTSRRRFFAGSLAAAIGSVAAGEVLAKGVHQARHTAKLATGHLVHGPHSSHSRHATQARGVSRRGVASPHLAKDLATGAPDAPVRRVSLHNLHTEERIDTVYFEDGRYVPEAMGDLKRFLRDFRNGQEHEIDAGLMDVLDAVRARSGARQPFQVISGYRSPATNAQLHEECEHSGVAVHSLHMQGQAIDIRAPDVALDHLRNTAFILQRGGVGYYPASGFVHVDVGDVRHWGFGA